MAEDCAPRWQFTSEVGEVNYPCQGAQLCPRPGPHGSIDIGVVITGGDGGPWTLVRDGETLLWDQIASPIVGAAGRGEDGCGRTGGLFVVHDPTTFGFHRYLLENPNAEIREVARGFAAGPGADSIVPGLVLGVVMIGLGRLLERVPAGWGF